MCVFCKDLGTQKPLIPYTALRCMYLFPDKKCTLIFAFQVRAMSQAVFDPLPRWPGFDAGQSISNVLWTEWHWDTFFSKYLDFPLSISFYQCSILVFIYMLLLTERKMGRNLGTFKTQGCFGQRRALNRNYFYFFFRL